MATQTTVRLVDDLSGEQADQTIEFGLDGRAYEIDLSDANAAKLREALAAYVGAARRAGRTAVRTAAPSRAPQRNPETRLIRACAVAQGYQISARGRIPVEIIEKYRADIGQSGPETVTEPAPVDQTPEQPSAPETPSETPDDQVRAWRESKGLKPAKRITEPMRRAYREAHAAT